MKTLTGALALMLALMFSAASVAVAAEKAAPPAAGQKAAPPTPADTDARQAPGQRGASGSGGVSSFRLLTGNVTGIDLTVKTFTIRTEGNEYKFTYQKIPFPYKVGDTIQVWAQVPAVSPKGPPAVMGTTIPHCASGDPLKGLNVHKSESSAKGPGPGCVPF